MNGGDFMTEREPNVFDYIFNPRTVAIVGASRNDLATLALLSTKIKDRLRGGWSGFHVGAAGVEGMHPKRSASGAYLHRRFQRDRDPRKGGIGEGDSTDGQGQDPDHRAELS